MHKLIKELFSRIISESKDKEKSENYIGIEAFDDGGVSPLIHGRVVISTDSYTVKPIRFPGGDIGKLAAYGSINDVAVLGAKPILATDSIVVEEGFDVAELKDIVNSLVQAFEQEKVNLIAGDFKVMPRGELDGIIITTTVLGILVNKEPILDCGAKPGDHVIVSGTIGEHGAVITAYQYGINPEDEGLMSDCAPVTKIMDIALKIGGIHAAKDPTRGGLAMALNEIAEKSRVSIWIDEEMIPIRDNVRSLMEILGIDPLYLACEGRVVLIVDRNRSEELLKALRKSGYDNAQIIGEVRKERPGYVIMETVAGGYRIIEKLRGELTPRIC